MKQTQSLDLLLVYFAAFCGVDSGCIDTAVAQDIRQTHYIFLYAVIRACKQMPQVMGKYLFLRHPCRLTQLFHIRPDVGPVKRSPGLCDKYRTRCDLSLF